MFFNLHKICRSCILLLKALAGSDYVKEAVVQNGAAPIVISAINRHKISPKLVAAGCVCIAALALRSPSNAQCLVDAGSPDLLITIMNMYKDNPIILKNACSAIRNQVSRCPHLKDNFIELGVEDLVNELKEIEGKMEFEYKGVLRDLGCDVKFNEEWRGEGHQLAQ
ncbi:hypothetical protein RUM43_005199 [Polyplax serrata]|uniref:Uncharacterized protein n=1 Tax=Polyplax serrata TaxID=468196 RepID=A0AAN8XMQ7_POLSC